MKIFNIVSLSLIIGLGISAAVFAGNSAEIDTMYHTHGQTVDMHITDEAGNASDVPLQYDTQTHPFTCLKNKATGFCHYYGNTQTAIKHYNNIQFSGGGLDACTVKIWSYIANMGTYKELVPALALNGDCPRALLSISQQYTNKVIFICAPDDTGPCLGEGH